MQNLVFLVSLLLVAFFITGLCIGRPDVHVVVFSKLESLEASDAIFKIQSASFGVLKFCSLAAPAYFMLQTFEGDELDDNVILISLVFKSICELHDFGLSSKYENID